MKHLVLIAIVLLAAAAASADSAAADRCAEKLAKDPRSIYDACAPSVQANTDLKALLKETAQGMVKAGTLARSDARASARAAYECLALKQQP